MCLDQGVGKSARYISASPVGKASPPRTRSGVRPHRCSSDFPVALVENCARGMDRRQYGETLLVAGMAQAPNFTRFCARDRVELLQRWENAGGGELGFGSTFY